MKKIDITEIVGDPISVRLSEYVGVSGNVSLFELICLAAIVNKRKPENIFEIGTFDGRTSLNMALNTSGKVYTLDLPKDTPTVFPVASTEMGYVNKEKSGTRFENRNLQIEQIYSDSASYDYSRFKNKIDLMFIDGSHTYEYVKKDTETALEIVKPGGVILWHDYAVGDWDGVWVRLNELKETERFRNLRCIKDTSLAYWVKE